ncbi:MAG: Uma2 family endonuclease [Verrucomicrobiota bacterium]
MVEAHQFVYQTPYNYLQRERLTEAKSDYLNGQIIAMAGGSFNHNMIQGNVTRRLATALENRPCVDFTADMKVRVGKANQFRYPDAFALCDDIEFYDSTHDAVKNPQLIVEVLSQSTERVDRNEKFADYRLIESFSEYLLLSQNEIKAELFQKNAQGEWSGMVLTGEDEQVNLQSIDVDLRLGDFYDKVDFSLT